MKDEQGIVITNPETMKIIRNLRGKAVHEGKKREHYIEMMIKSLQVKYPYEPFDMELIEDHGQEWCLYHGIIGYDYIVTTNVNTDKSGKI